MGTSSVIVCLCLQGESGDGNVPSQPDIAKLQAQIRDAKAVIQQLEMDREMAIAQVKQQVKSAFYLWFFWRMLRRWDIVVNLHVLKKLDRQPYWFAGFEVTA